MSIKTSEWVSLGHPDKTADYISSYILDRYIEKDPNVRYALEIMIKDNNIFLGGEITSTEHYTDYDLSRFAKKALAEIGYTVKYHEKWGNHTIDPRNIKVTSVVSQQSPNIAQGVDNDGWGDQGIFFGYAENDVDYMSGDYTIAKRLGQFLYQQAKEKGIGGLDIKTQVTCTDLLEKNVIENVIVAIPILNDEEKSLVEKSVKQWLKDVMNEDYDELPYQLIINGTGEYKTHSSIGDCGITGRKLVVDFYGSSSRIGGGSPWTKDPSKSDLALNLYARKLAVEKMKEFENNEYVHHIEVELESCIGQPCKEITYKIYGYNHLLETIYDYTNLTPSSVSKELDLKKPIYTELCRDGLFSKIS